MKKWVMSILVVFFLVTLVAYPSPTSSNAASNQGNSVLRMTLLIPPNSLNFLTLSTGGSGYQIIGSEYQQMGGIHNPDGSIAPYHNILDWITSNSNYTQWEFNVAPGTKWSDGTNVTSKDILTSYGPDFYFNQTYDFLGLGPEVANEYELNSSTAVYVLTSPDPLFGQKLGGSYYGGVYPASVINSQGNNYDFFGNSKVDGPFYAANYSAGQTTMTLFRNPYFSPAPNISQIDINFVETLSLTATYIESGSTDLAQVEWSNIPSVLKNPNVGLIDEKGFDMTTLQYNDSVYPYNVTAFRQALAFGINQSELINQAFSGYGIPGYSGEGAVSPTVTRWYNPNQTQYQFSITKADSLLSSAGFTKGQNGQLQYPNGTAVILNLWADTDNTADLTAASVVQSNLQSLGFQVKVHTTTEANIIGDYNSNLQGVTNSMLLYTASVAMLPGVPFYAILPGWDYYWGPVVPSNYWEWPPSVDAQYWSNESAFWNATTHSARYQDLANVQSINSKALPTLVLAYPDNVWAYNKQRWAGWPSSGVIDVGGGYFNNTALVDLYPVLGASSTSASTSFSPSTTIAPSTSSSARATTAVGSTSQTSTTQSTASSSSTSLGSQVYVILAALAVFIVAGGALGLSVRKRKDT